MAQPEGAGKGFVARAFLEAKMKESEVTYANWRSA
jgi:hypothetical protein